MPAELMQERVRIAGPRGALAGVLTYPFGQTLFSMLLANPHPHMGGHTGNSLLSQIAETVAERSGVVLSFDYSGVGESEGPRVDVAGSMSQFWQTGVAPEDPILVDDVRYALAWMLRTAPAPYILLGYSFGAYAAATVLNDDADGLILISPAIRQHDLAPLTRCGIPKLVIYADNDFATGHEEIEAWIGRLPEPLDTLCVPGGDHFFRVREAEVALACATFARRLVERVA